MKVRTLSWVVVGAIALGAILLFNYWASFEPLSLLAYSGFVLTFAGLANLAIPFRFLGVSKRRAGALIAVGGAGLAVAALLWPAATTRVTQHRNHLDDVMPEYQFSEIHTVRSRATPQRVIEAARESTWGDLRSLNTLLKVRAAMLHEPLQNEGYFSPEKRVSDSFTASGYLSDTSDREFTMFGAVNTRLRRFVAVKDWREFAEYRDEGTVKTAFDFRAEDTGGGWTTITTETRMMVYSASTRDPAIYWRLIVPGSGLLRREWLEGIRRRAESGM
ncbi:MAG TPA: hypothetical protein VMT38_04535 [Terracidiphilus sp.]|nr:hypothetical protein [Terracidiphilus sp.]